MPKQDSPLATQSAVQQVEPFGFKAEMSKSQIFELLGKNSISEDKEDELILKAAPRPQPEFEAYLVFVSSGTGVAKVSGLSRDIDSNSFGSEMRSKFEEIQSALEGKYGKYTKTYDFLMSGSIWKEPGDWMTGLYKKE